VAEQLSCPTGSDGDPRGLGKIARVHPVEESEGISREATCSSHKEQALSSIEIGIGMGG